MKTEEMRHALYNLCDHFEVDVIMDMLGDVLESVDDWKDKAELVYEAAKELHDKRMLSPWKI